MWRVHRNGNTCHTAAPSHNQQPTTAGASTAASGHLHSTQTTTASRTLYAAIAAGKPPGAAGTPMRRTIEEMYPSFIMPRPAKIKVVEIAPCPAVTVTGTMSGVRRALNLAPFSDAERKTVRELPGTVHQAAVLRVRVESQDRAGQLADMINKILAGHLPPRDDCPLRAATIAITTAPAISAAIAATVTATAAGPPSPTLNTPSALTSSSPAAAGAAAASSSSPSSSTAWWREDWLCESLPHMSV